MSIFYNKFRATLLEIVVGLTYSCEPRNWNYASPEVTRENIRNASKKLNALVARMDEYDDNIQNTIPPPEGADAIS